MLPAIMERHYKRSSIFLQTKSLTIMITIDELIKQAFAEDVADGDHTTLATVDKNIIQKSAFTCKRKWNDCRR